MTTKTPVTKTKRKDPSAILRDEVLREAGYKCGNPVCRNVLVLQLHHIEWLKDEGPTVAANLLPLCGHCHDLHTHGQISPAAIRHWKGLLVALNQAFSRESMDLLLFVSTPNVEKIWYSGDGLLHFAGLIAAGLVEVKQFAFAGSARSKFVMNGDYASAATAPPPATGARVGLSEKGRLLVDSWLNGDERTYAKALGYELPELADE